MIKRYSLRRSDNAPATGQAAFVVPRAGAESSSSSSGSASSQSSFALSNGRFRIDTGFPVSSAVISDAVVSDARSAAGMVLDEGGTELEYGVLDYTLAPSQAILISQIELHFIDDDVARDVVVEAALQRQTLTLVNDSNVTTQEYLVRPSLVLQAGETLRLFADKVATLKSSSSSTAASESSSSTSSSGSSSTSSTTAASESSSSTSSTTAASESSSSSSLSQSSPSSSSTTSSSSTNSSSTSSSGSSSSSKSSSSSTPVSFSSSQSSRSSSTSSTSTESSSSTSTESSSSSSSPSSSSTSSSSPSSSSSSSSIIFRVAYRIYYTPLAFLERLAQGTGLQVKVDGYDETGFTVRYENAPEDSVLTLSYLAV